MVDLFRLCDQPHRQDRPVTAAGPLQVSACRPDRRDTRHLGIMVCLCKVFRLPWLNAEVDISRH